MSDKIILHPTAVEQARRSIQRVEERLDELKGLIKRELSVEEAIALDRKINTFGSTVSTEWLGVIYLLQPAMQNSAFIAGRNHATNKEQAYYASKLSGGIDNPM